MKGRERNLSRVRERRGGKVRKRGEGGVVGRRGGGEESKGNSKGKLLVT